MSGVQFRVIVGKKDERVDGPDDAEVVATIALADVTLDPSVAFMLGRLKSTGPTGPLFDALSSGEATRRISELARDA